MILPVAIYPLTLPVMFIVMWRFFSLELCKLLVYFFFFLCFWYGGIVLCVDFHVEKGGFCEHAWFVKFKTKNQIENNINMVYKWVEFENKKKVHKENNVLRLE